MPKKKSMSGKPEVHEELEGFEMGINEFGEITSNMQIDKINKFLNKHVDDKKFKDLNAIPYAKKGDDEDEDDDDDDFDDDDEFDDFDEDDDSGFDEDLDDLEEIVGNKSKGKGKKGADDDDINEEEFLDEYADDFSEEDDYDFDDN